MKVKYIFIDIDGTLAVYPGGREFTVSPMTLLEDLDMEKYDLSRQEAYAKIRGCGDTAVCCLSEFLEELRIPREAYFKAMQGSLEGNIRIPDDSVRLQ